MTKYLLIFRLSAQEVFQYRLDFLVHLFKYAFMILLMIFVWLAVEKEVPTGFSRQETISYFFLGAMIYSLSNFHTFYIEDDIRLGSLTKFMLKPMNPFWHYFFYEAGVAVLDTVAKAIIFMPLLFLLGLKLTTDPIRWLFLCLFFPLIFFFAFNLFNLISSLAFWLTEAYAIRWSLMIVFRFLSGMLVPIAFFPAVYQNIFFFLPFEHLAYTPIRLIQEQLSYHQALLSLLILGGWTAVVFTIRKTVWSMGEKNYEGTGL